MNFIQLSRKLINYNHKIQIKFIIIFWQKIVFTYMFVCILTLINF